jgi:hypothetical protein
MKTKIPNLSTLEAAITKTGHYITPDYEVRFTRGSFFSVKKNGVTRIYADIRDAWRALK